MRQRNHADSGQQRSSSGLKPANRLLQVDHVVKLQQRRLIVDPGLKCKAKTKEYGRRSTTSNQRVPLACGERAGWLGPVASERAFFPRLRGVQKPTERDRGQSLFKYKDSCLLLQLLKRVTNGKKAFKSEERRGSLLSYQRRGYSYKEHSGPEVEQIEDGREQEQFRFQRERKLSSLFFFRAEVNVNLETGGDQ